MSNKAAFKEVIKIWGYLFAFSGILALLAGVAQLFVFLLELSWILGLITLCLVLSMFMFWMFKTKKEPDYSAYDTIFDTMPDSKELEDMLR
jgi:hypothetical protein